MRWVKPWIVSLGKLCFGTYFILTSLYCLLAFIPYTYFFLVKEPPSEALIVFVRYHSLLYWFALGAGLLAYWTKRRHWMAVLAWILLVAIGVLFTAKNFLPHIQNNWVAYCCGLLVLLPMLVLACAEAIRSVPVESPDTRASLLCYSNGVIVAMVVAAVSVEAILVKNYCDDTAAGSGLVFCTLE